MAAFIVFTRERTRDLGELAIYADMAPAGLAGHPITIRALYGRIYSEARKHRLKGGDYHAIIVEST